jgi:hypothetical protein
MGPLGALNAWRDGRARAPFAEMAGSKPGHDEFDES